MSAQEVNKNEETGFGDEFKKVESRKRKADEKMDDRPYFEPIAADKMGSKKKGAPDVRRGMFTVVMQTLLTNFFQFQFQQIDYHH